MTVERVPQSLREPVARPYSLSRWPIRALCPILAAALFVMLGGNGAALAKGKPKPAPPPQLSPEESRLRVAQETFTRGVELYEKGEIAKAEEQLRLAAQLAPGKPKPFYYLGRVFLELARCPEALANLDIYFRLSPPDHENRTHATEMKTKCENEIARKGGTLLVDTTPDGAAVMIDEENAIPVGVTPFGTDRLVAGSHVVFLRKPGYQRVFRPVNLVAGQLVRLVVTLDEERAAPSAPVAEAPKPLAVPPAAPPPPPVVVTPAPALPEPSAAAAPKPEPKSEPPAAVVRTEPPRSKPAVDQPAPSEPQGSSQKANLRSAGVALLVVGVLGGAAGGVTGWLLGRDSDARDSASLSFQAGGAAVAHGSPYSAMMITSIAAGTALAGTGALLIGLSTRKEARPAVSLTPVLVPGVGGAWVGMSGRFW